MMMRIKLPPKETARLLPPGAAPEECICVDMEFTEKYEIVHKVEIQSERYGTMNMHCVTALADHFKARCIEKKTWYFNTDGAPSHSCNPYSSSRPRAVLPLTWETCAPGHGKGPWVHHGIELVP